MRLLIPPNATQINPSTGISRQIEVSHEPAQGILPHFKQGLLHQIILRFRQYASSKQPKEEIPVYMTHCFGQILTLASQPFPFYHFSRSPESYIILQSSQYGQEKLDRLFGLLSFINNSFSQFSISLKHKRRKKSFSKHRNRLTLFWEVLSWKSI